MNKYDKEAQQWVKKQDWEDERASEFGACVTWMAGLGGFALAVYCVFEFLMGA